MASPFVWLLDDERLPYQDDEDEILRSALSLELDAFRRVNQLPPPPPLASLSLDEEEGGGGGGGREAIELARLRPLVLVVVPADET